MNNTLEKRLMAFMNCPWKSTAECNYICVDCFHSDPDGLKTIASVCLVAVFVADKFDDGYFDEEEDDGD